MTKRELVDIVARKAHLTKRAAEEAINVFLSEIGRALGKGESRIMLSGGFRELKAQSLTLQPMQSNFFLNRSR